jgi:hypothetical protein
MDNIKLDLKGIGWGGMGWIYLDKRQAVVDMGMNA